MMHIKSIIEFDNVLSHRSGDHLELFIKSKNGASITVLINGSLGWLMYLRCGEDVGFSSRNLNYKGDDVAVIEYCLENGQVDQYPASWAYPMDLVRLALVQFMEFDERPVCIDWHAD